VSNLGGKAAGLAALVRGLRELVVVYLPGDAGVALRGRHYRRRLRSLGADVLIDVGVQFVNPEYISIGDNSWIDKYTVLLAGPPHRGERTFTYRQNEHFRHAEGELVIGRNCHIAPHVVVIAHGGVAIGDNCAIAAGAKIISLTHEYRNPADPGDEHWYAYGSRVPERDQSLISGPVVLEEGAGMGTNSIALPGTTIGRYGGLAMGSILTRSVAAGRFAFGVPARAVFGRRRAEGKDPGRTEDG
jgi:acetyltransferase-like isoleucine patch superfamily enzyme